MPVITKIKNIEKQYKNINIEIAKNNNDINKI